jgi:hypothetical protein
VLNSHVLAVSCQVRTSNIIDTARLTRHPPCPVWVRRTRRPNGGVASRLPRPLGDASGHRTVVRTVDANAGQLRVSFRATCALLHQVYPHKTTVPAVLEGDADLKHFHRMGDDGDQHDGGGSGGHERDGDVHPRWFLCHDVPGRRPAAVPSPPATRSPSRRRSGGQEGQPPDLRAAGGAAGRHRRLHLHLSGRDARGGRS